MTSAAIEELTAEGVAAVFNTPNDRSRPGYLKMGWVEVARLPVYAAPCSPRSLLSFGKNGAATKWGEPLDVGERPAAAFADQAGVAALLSELEPARGWVTPRSYSQLCWRFSLESLGYRVWKVHGNTEEGLVIFRVRRRGGLRELTLVDVLLPSGGRLPVRLWHTLARRGAADVVTTSVGTRRSVRGLASLPRRLGPVLTWRPLAENKIPTKRQISFAHADLELF